MLKAESTDGGFLKARMRCALRDGTPAHYGEISFDGSVGVSNYVVVGDRTSGAVLASILKKYWKLSQPELIVSVAGSVQNFELPKVHAAALEAGLLDLIRSKQTWFNTGGTDSGAFKLMGDVWKRHAITAPLIGVSCYGSTFGRELLLGGGGVRHYGQQPPPGGNGAPLNPDHSHFVLVDTGVEGGAAFGTEVGFGGMVEDAIARSEKAPLVELVIQGGVGTLNAIRDMVVVNGAPSVLLVQTGGAALAVFQASFLHSLSSAFHNSTSHWTTPHNTRPLHSTLLHTTPHHTIPLHTAPLHSTTLNTTPHLTVRDERQGRRLALPGRDAVAMAGRDRIRVQPL